MKQVLYGFKRDVECNMNEHVLLNLLHEGVKDKMRGFAEHLIGFPQRV